MSVEPKTAGQEEIAHEITIFAEPIFHIKNFTVTNALLTSWFAVILIIIFAAILRKKLAEVPKGIQNIFEAVVDGGLGLCDQVTGSRALSEKIFPLAISVFLFILVNNWLGLLPVGGFGILEKALPAQPGGHGLAFVPFLRGGTADVNTTLALAVMAVIGANLFGIFSIGVWKIFNKYVNLKALGQIFTKIKQDKTVIIVAPITFFVGLLELIGEFAKVASLSFRLFGNVFAGEVLLAAMAALIAFILPVPFLFLEILVGVIQALIFSMLLVVYFTISATDHEEHEKGHEQVLSSSSP